MDAQCSNQPVPHREVDEDADLPHEDIGDVAYDDSDEFDDVGLPARRTAQAAMRHVDLTRGRINLPARSDENR
jgi:hypothetical protein